jgi:hypothetical protein
LLREKRLKRKTKSHPKAAGASSRILVIGCYCSQTRWHLLYHWQEWAGYPKALPIPGQIPVPCPHHWSFTQLS